MDLFWQSNVSNAFRPCRPGVLQSMGSQSQTWLSKWSELNCCMLGFPVLHYLFEYTQTQVHWFSDATQTSHPLSSPSLPTFNPSQHQGLFKWVSSSHQGAKYWSFSFNISPSNEHPRLISFRMDWWISLQSKGFSRVFSNTTVQKHQFFDTQLSLESNSHIHR